MNNKPSRQVLRARRRAGLSTPERQRGAAAVFAAVALIAGIVAMLLGINIGMLYYAQRNLQKLATVGAMAGVQVSSGCRNGSNLGVPGNTALVTASVLQAIKNNNLNANGTDNGSAALLTGIGGSPAVQVGVINNGSGIHKFSPLSDGSSQINAVRVNLTQPAPSVLGVTLFRAITPITLMASATAQEQPLGGFYIGSTLANLNTEQSILNPLLTGLLGATVNLSAADFTNLASTQISLAGLMVAAGVNDLNSLLAVSTNVAGLQQLLVTATNTVNPSVSQLVQGLALGNAQANTPVSLANLLGNIGNGLNPTVNDAASLVPSLDLLDLLTQLGETAAAANPNNFLQLVVTPSIPGLLNTYVFLSVQQPMQPGFGPVGATAQTAQVQLSVRLNVDTAGLTAILNLLKSLTLGIISITVQPINVGLDLQVANAVATLNNLTCPSDTTPNPTATIGVNSHVATLLDLGTFTGSAQSNPQVVAGNLLSVSTNVNLLGLTLLSATVGFNNLPGPLNVGSTAGAQAGPFSIYGPPTVPSQAQPHTYNYPACNSLTGTANPCSGTVDPNNPYAAIPSGDLLGGISTYVGQLVGKNNLAVVVTLLNIPIDVSGILDPLVSDLNTFLIGPLTNLLDQLLNPLLAALGVQLGSGTVLMNNVVTSQPILVTSCLPIPVASGAPVPPGVCPP